MRGGKYAFMVLRKYLIIFPHIIPPKLQKWGLKSNIPIFNNSIITTNQINGAYHEITKKKKVYQGDIIGEGNANNIAYHS